MSVTVYFANVSKKRNSTYRGTFAVSYDCNLKAPTSLDRPTFLVSAETMDYNAAKWGDRYYFIDDVVSVRNGQWEVSCVLDVLATYKTEITSSTQFVTYSSSKSSDWLPDTRIPVLTSEEYRETESLDVGMFSKTGFYVLTVVGKNGCVNYGVSKNTIDHLIEDVQDWVNGDFAAILAGNYNPMQPMTYDWTGVEASLKSLAEILTQSGCVGNAYQNAPQMIRSCIWVPLNLDYFESGASQTIYLGNYSTNYTAVPIKSTPSVISLTTAIPWKHSDWRRSVCESVYVRLPYAGLIQLSSDSIASESSLYITVSACAIDGTVSYQVSTSDGKAIGYYAGSCSAPYAIGINQRSGAAEVLQTAIAGMEKTVSVAVNSSISPLSIAAATVGTALEGVNAAYNVADVAMSTNPSCIGNMGGASSTGLNQKMAIIVIAHETVIEPSAMQNTMGLPTMKPLSLSGLTGFCQCANAHVAAAAQATELDAIDSYLNTGFFIE